MRHLIEQINEALTPKPRYLIKVTKSSNGYTFRYFDLMFDKTDYAVFDGKRFVERDSKGASYYTGGLGKLQSIFKNANIDPARFVKPSNLGQAFALLTDNYPYGKIVGYEKYKYSTPRGF